MCFAKIVERGSIAFTILSYFLIWYIVEHAGGAIKGNYAALPALSPAVSIRQIPLSVLFLVLASLVYVYTFYRNIIMYHKDRQKGCIKFSYPTACSTGLLAILNSDIWPLFLGIGNAARGATSFLVSLDRDINSEAEMSSGCTG